MSFRSFTGAFVAAGLGVLLLALQLVGAGSALASSGAGAPAPSKSQVPIPCSSGPCSGSVSITTDRSQYMAGDSIKVCYTVAGPGPFTITDIEADGSSHTFFAGIDDGTGGCLGGTVTPPSGNECLSIVAQGGMGGSAQTCFQVGQGTTPPPPPPPPGGQCGTVTTLNGHLTSSGAQQVEDCFYQAYQQCNLNASLEFRDAGIDSGTKYSFEVKANGGACFISERMESLGIATPPTFGSCTGLTETQFGLLFLNCLSGNVVVPNS